MTTVNRPESFRFFKSLTHAEIAALPTTGPFSVTPKSGAGYAYIPDRIVVVSRKVAAYTGIDANSAYLTAQWDDYDEMADGFGNDVTVNGSAFLTALLGGSGAFLNVVGRLHAEYLTVGLGRGVAVDDPMIILNYSKPLRLPFLENRAVQIVCYNGADFTGGNAANSLSFVTDVTRYPVTLP